MLVISLNTLAVWLAYRAARHYEPVIGAYGPLITAFLMAVNPWVVEYSRTTWVQCLLPFFACLIFWLFTPVWLGSAARPARRTVLGVVAVTAMTETYLLAFIILAPIGLLFLLSRKHIPWRATAIGAGLFIGVTAIYGAGLYANRDETLKRIGEFSQGPSRLSSEAWSHAVRLVTGRDYAIARGVDAPIADSLLRFNLSEVAHGVLLAALLVGLIVGVLAAFRRNPRAWIVLTWFGLPIALMSYVSRPVHPFYLLVTLPAGYVLAAWGISTALRAIRLPLRGRIGLFAATGIALTLLSWANVVRFAEQTLAKPGAHGLTALPISAGLAMMNAVAAHVTQPNPTNSVLFADVDEWLLDSFAGRLYVVDRDIDTARTLYIPEAGGLYLFFSAPKETLPTPPLDSAPTRLTLVDGSTLSLFAVNRDLRIAFKQPPVPSDMGIAFRGYQMEGALRPGATVTLRTAWSITDLKPDRAQWLLGPFVHVFDGNGNRILIGDGAVTPGANWRLGDWHLKSISMRLPSDAVGPFSLQFGLYDGVHSRGALFTMPDRSLSPTLPVKAP